MADALNNLQAMDVLTPHSVSYVYKSSAVVSQSSSGPAN